jgi:hypothetical protein
MQELTADQVRALLRDATSTGSKISIRFTTHADDELQKDRKTRRDAINVLRGGFVDRTEWDVSHCEWRYRVSTSRMSVVISIDSSELEPQPPATEGETRTVVVVITAWSYR